MGYRFTRGWGRASVVVGAGVFVLALLLASWLGFSNDAEFERFSPAVRILAFLVVSLAGLIVGGTMIVAGQLVSAVLDQRDLLARIYEVLAAKAGASGEAITRRTAMSVTIALLAVTTLLGGCATARIAWDKPGVAQAERERDENACFRAAIGTDGGGPAARSILHRPRGLHPVHGDTGLHRSIQVKPALAVVSTRYEELLRKIRSRLEEIRS